MKTIACLFLVSLTILTSCNFSVGTNKDFGTGLSYNYNGFAVDEVVLVNAANERATTNEVVLNTKIAIVAQGLTNYQLKDDKAFPGLALTVKDKQGNSIIEEADLFSQSEGYSAQDASAIRGTITVASPMKSGESYDVFMRVWDKTNPENELTATLEIVVK